MISASTLAALAIAVVPAIVAAQSEHFTLHGDRVAVYNLAGKLDVRGGGSDVEVELTRGGADAKSLRVESGEVRGHVALRVLYPSDRIVYPRLERWSRTSLRVQDDGTFDDDSGDRGSGHRVDIRGDGSGSEAYADLTVTVPKGRSVDLHLGVGDTHISNVDGDLRVSVASSLVVSDHTSGHLSLSTGSGGLRVTEAQGDVDLETGSGGMSVSGVKGENLRLEAGSGSLRGSDIEVGELRADVGSGGARLLRVKAPRVSLESGSGGAELELLSDVDDLRIDNGSGGVTLRLPASVSAQVNVETGSGGIDSELPVQVTRVERRRLNGTLGGGKGRIRIESGSGTVHILKS